MAQLLNQGTSDTPYLQLQLGQAELLCALRLLGVPTLPGLDDEGLDHLSTRELDLLMAAGEDSLRARHLLQTAPAAKSGVALSEVALAIIGTCITAHTLVTVSWESSVGDEDNRFYYVGDHLTVEHGMAEAGVYRFIACMDPEPSLNRISDQMGLWHRANESMELRASHVRVRQSALERARNQVRVSHDPDGAVQSLRDGGSDTSAGEELAAALGASEAVTTITFLKGTSENADGGGVVVLHEPEGLWILEPGEGDDPVVDCQRATPQQVFERLSQFLAP